MKGQDAIGFWDTFFIRHSGEEESAFQDLVTGLLPELKPGDWRWVEDANSKGRKFEIQDQHRGDIWADFGMQSSDYSLSALSPSLVMAVNRSISSIYFFSIHKLPVHTKHYLGQYQERSGTQVYVFDDHCLEIAVLGIQKVMERFYSDVHYKEGILAPPFEVHACFSKDPQIEYFHKGPEYSEDRPVSVKLYSIFVIDITLNNDNPMQSIEGTIDFDQGYDPLFFMLLGEGDQRTIEQTSFWIGPGGLFHKRFYFKVIRPGQNLVLPQAKVQLLEGQASKQAVCSPKRVSVSNVLQTPLIGRKPMQTLQAIGETIHGSTQPNVILVHGRSGTGKSRLLKEVQEISFKIRSLSIYIDEESLSNLDLTKLLRILFSKIFRLPLIQNLNEGQGLQKLRLLKKDDIIYHVLYDEHPNLEGKLEACIQALLQGAKNTSVDLLLDNVQNFDGPIIRFLEKFIASSESSHISFNLVLCFNTDILFDGTPANKLFQSIKVRAESNNPQTSSYLIPNFSEEDVVSYLNHCFSDSKGGFQSETLEQRWPQILALFQEKVLRRPLFLEQTLLLLSDENVIRWNFDQLYVSDVKSFIKILKSLPTKIDSLLARRWGTIRKNLGEDVEKLLVPLVYINPMPGYFIDSLDIEEKTFQSLQDRGIITLLDGGETRFYHFQLFLFFKKQYAHLPRKTRVSLIEKIENSGIQDLQYFSFFFLKAQTMSLKPEEIDKGVGLVKAINSFQNFLPEFLQSLGDQLLRSTCNVEKSKLLRVLKWIGRKFQVFEGNERSYDFHQKVYPWVRMKKSEFLPYGNSFFIYVREYMHIARSLSLTDIAQNVLLEWIDECNQFQFNSEREKAITIADARNRLCVIYKDLGDRTRAWEEGMGSLEIANLHAHTSFQIQNYIDLGHVLEKSISEVPAILNQWEKAIALYHQYKDSDEEVRHWRVMVQLYEGMVVMLKQDCVQGVHLFEDGIRYCDAKLEIGYGIRYRIYYVMANLICNVEYDTGRLRSVLNRAEELCILTQRHNLYWKVLFLNGIYFYAIRSENYQVKIKDYMLMSLESFQKYNLEKEGVQKPYIKESALLLREAKGHFEPWDSERIDQIVQKIQDPELRKQFQDILEMEDDLFNNWRSAKQPLLPFSFQNIDLPF